MIELFPAEHDDSAFLALAQQIINGAIAKLRVREVYLVCVDNWFDVKWLRWRSRKEGELRVPLFTPNRVLSEKHFIWDEKKLAWASADLARPLHTRQPGRPSLAQPLDRFSKHAAFIWYSGNTATNKMGSLMVYLSGSDGYAWYASLKRDEHWVVMDEFQITRRELVSFEESGRQMEIERAASASAPIAPSDHSGR